MKCKTKSNFGVQKAVFPSEKHSIDMLLTYETNSMLFFSINERKKWFLSNGRHLNV